MYSSKTTNPFYENEDDGNPVHPPCATPFNDRLERRGHILHQINDSETRQLASTQRALASICDSERMGIATAEELVHQGEQLDNIERRTAEIDKNLTISQRHLNSIKSVFGGIKTWWSGGTRKAIDCPSPTSISLRETVQQKREDYTHPTLRLKSEDSRGLYEDDSDLNLKFRAGAKNELRRTDDGPMFKCITKSEKECQLDHNLSLMSDGMAKLKGLALDLGNEIEQQNDQLDRININVIRADDNITDKNMQMRQILRK